VEHIHRTGDSSRVDHAEGARFIAHTNLLDTLADARHRLEIVRLLAALHTIELLTSILPRVDQKLAQALERVAEAANRLDARIISV
jgi:hypothetical protein